MIKRMLIFLFTVFVVSNCWAIDRQEQADFKGVGFSSNVIVSTDVWTAIPSTNIVSSDQLVTIVSAYDSNTSNFLLKITTTPLSEGTTEQGITFKPSDTPKTFSLRGTVLWLWAIVNGALPQKLFVEVLK